MRKFLLKVALFFLLMAGVDMASGWGFSILRSKANGGQTYKNEYLAKKCMDDVLILGSSKADHHYIPSIMEDSLGLTCYNAGEMGCGIIPAYVRYKLVAKRKKPSFVLYEITPNYDYLKDDNYSRYLGTIRQYVSDPMVREVYLDFSDELDRLRLMSNLYRNNSNAINNLKDVLGGSLDQKGYEPLYGHLEPKSIKNPKQENKQIDPLKLSYLERLVTDCKHDGVKIAFIISPRFSKTPGGRMKVYEPVFELAQKYDIPIINNLNVNEFNEKSEYFQDDGHLNHHGATAYSKFIIPQISEIIN